MTHPSKQLITIRFATNKQNYLIEITYKKIYFLVYNKSAMDLHKLKTFYVLYKL